MFGIHVLTLLIFSTSCAAFECLVSCTELITSITCLQVVQRGLINFDDLSDEILRGLALRPMFERNDDQTFTMREANKRLHDDTAQSHQWAHTDWMGAKLAAWRIYAEKLSQAWRVVTSPAIMRNARPYEAGKSCAYSGGLDWASLLVARFTEIDFEDYVAECIAKPLGNTLFTWHLPQKSAIAQKIFNMVRDKKTALSSSEPIPIWKLNPLAEGGGVDMYAAVHDYMHVLADLLKDQPILLLPSSADQQKTAGRKQQFSYAVQSE
jgi:hypothetical protein